MSNKVDLLLAEWQVDNIGILTEEEYIQYVNVREWYRVSNDDGVIAYFENEKDALSFRLWKINQLLNG